MFQQGGTDNVPPNEKTTNLADRVPRRNPLDCEMFVFKKKIKKPHERNVAKKKVKKPNTLKVLSVRVTTTDAQHSP